MFRLDDTNLHLNFKRAREMEPLADELLAMKPMPEPYRWAKEFMERYEKKHGKH